MSDKLKLHGIFSASAATFGFWRFSLSLLLVAGLAVSPEVNAQHLDLYDRSYVTPDDDFTFADAYTQVTVKNGYHMDVSNLYWASAFVDHQLEGDDGKILISGNGSYLKTSEYETSFGNSFPDVYLRLGELNVSNGGRVESHWGNVTGNTSINLTGDGTRWDLESSLSLFRDQDFGDPNMNVSSGATFKAIALFNSSQVDLSGNATLDAGNLLRIGRSGSGRINVSNNSTVEAATIAVGTTFESVEVEQVDLPSYLLVNSSEVFAEQLDVGVISGERPDDSLFFAQGLVVLDNGSELQTEGRIAITAGRLTSKASTISADRISIGNLLDASTFSKTLQAEDTNVLVTGSFDNYYGGRVTLSGATQLTANSVTNDGGQINLSGETQLTADSVRNEGGGQIIVSNSTDLMTNSLRSSAGRVIFRGTSQIDAEGDIRVGGFDFGEEVVSSDMFIRDTASVSTTNFWMEDSGTNTRVTLEHSSNLATNLLEIGSNFDNIRGSSELLVGGSAVLTADWVVFNNPDSSISLEDNATINATTLELDTDPFFENGDDDGNFNMLGGRLNTNIVIGNLVQAGGVLGAGTDSRLIDLRDSFEMNSGAIDFTIGGLERGVEFSAIDIGDSALLDGILDLNLEGFTPVAGDSFDLINGSFSSSNNQYVFDFSNAELTEGLLWNTSLFETSGLIFVVNAVPEPSAALISLLLFMIILAARSNSRHYF
jgi:hypothetical protein